MDFVLIGPGRAGSSMRSALEARGWKCLRTYGRGEELEGIEHLGADLVVLAVPDGAIASVAAALPVADTTVIHLSGATTLEPVRRHPNAGSLHPLTALPDRVTGAASLTNDCSFAVASTSAVAASLLDRIVSAFGGASFAVPDDQRARYHAAAAIAANHVLALVAQIERIAATANVPSSVFVPLVHGALDNAREQGARAALTGPIARGDWETVRRHLEAIDTSEHGLYLTLARAVADLAGQRWPEDLS